MTSWTDGGPGPPRRGPGAPPETSALILVDTGHSSRCSTRRTTSIQRCRRSLQRIGEPIVTTVPVLTEAFHMLSPESIGSNRLRDFIEKGGLSVWFFEATALTHAFELMEVYADHPMDLADASLIVAAEAMGIRKVFAIDRKDFQTYRIRRGHRSYPVEIVR